MSIDNLVSRYEKRDQNVFASQSTGTSIAHSLCYQQVGDDFESFFGAGVGHARNDGREDAFVGMALGRREGAGDREGLDVTILPS